MSDVKRRRKEKLEDKQKKSARIGGVSLVLVREQLSPLICFGEKLKVRRNRCLGTSEGQMITGSDCPNAANQYCPEGI